MLHVSQSDDVSIFSEGKGTIEERCSHHANGVTANIQTYTCEGCLYLYYYCCKHTFPSSSRALTIVCCISLSDIRSDETGILPGGGVSGWGGNSYRN